MDWDWRRFSWNSTFPENQDELGDFGAQLGGLKRKEAPPSPTMADSKLKSNDSKDSSASKKLCPLKGSQKLTCLADGCKSNLNNCKDYHRRHRVCEHHSKTPVVIIRGEEKRFCQQCSRFHSLAEFDEVKRSCRKRLDGHNRRRRKPQPESIYMSSKDFLSINFKGPRILKFSDPETYESMWPSFSKTEAQATTIHNRHQWMQINDRQIPSKLSSAYYALNGEGGGGVGGGGDKHFSSPLLKTGLKHGSHQIVPNFPACQTLPITITSPESGWETHKVPSDAGPPLPLDSGGALYLLSTYPTGQVSDIGLSCLVQPNATHPPDPPDRISIFDPNKTGIPCTETMMIHMGETDHGLFECEVSPKLPLSWE